MNWHQDHEDTLGFAGELADQVASFMGSWKFIIIQTGLVAMWMVLNLVGFVYHWDAYPFILLNLVFSTQAAYAAPIIMQSQNRQAERDRHHAEADYQINCRAKEEIEQLMSALARIESEKLDHIIQLLNSQNSKS